MTGSARRRAWPLLVVAAVPLALIGVLVLGALHGMRWFVVETPSMGTAAPVGSLVIDAPLDGPAQVGRIVTYRPPDAGAPPITHRVVGVSAAGVRTRGDINGEADPWTTPIARVIGGPVAILPGVGWVLRALPFLVGGLLPVLLLSRLLRAPAHRTAVRMLGISVVVAAVLMWLRPLLNATVVTTTAASGGVEAQVVSTGLLPIRVSVGDSSAHLVAGEVGRLLLPASGTGSYTLATALDVGPFGWVLLAAVCAAPVLWTFVAGPSSPVPGRAAA